MLFGGEEVAKLKKRAKNINNKSPNLHATKCKNKSVFCILYNWLQVICTFRLIANFNSNGTATSLLRTQKVFFPFFFK